MKIVNKFVKHSIHTHWDETSSITIHKDVEVLAINLGILTQYLNRPNLETIATRLTEAGLAGRIGLRNAGPMACQPWDVTGVIFPADKTTPSVSYGDNVITTF